MAAIREATATWQGDLKSGSGTVTGESSGSFDELGLSWKARASAPNGQTSPEELLAAAHAGCFSMALAGALAREGHRPYSLRVRCRVSFDANALRVTGSELEVHGEVPGIEAQNFERLAREAKEGCPISRALEGNLDVSLQATLESGAGLGAPGP